MEVVSVCMECEYFVRPEYKNQLDFIHGCTKYANRSPMYGHWVPGDCKGLNQFGNCGGFMPVSAVPEKIIQVAGLTEESEKILPLLVGYLVYFDSRVFVVKKDVIKGRKRIRVLEKADMSKIENQNRSLFDGFRP